MTTTGVGTPGTANVSQRTADSVRPGVVGIVGLGLLGGSLARDLAAAGWRVQGTDRDRETERRAREAGVVSGPIDPAVVDMVVLAVPVRAAPGRLHGLVEALSPDAVVTDVGSTKRSVIEAAEAAGLGRRFVGSHPMAGAHTSGWDAGRTGLFEDATVWMCPTHTSTAAAVSRVADLWRTVGGRPRHLDADDHDRLVARASHAPQVVATALALALARDGIDPDILGGGGRDMTRLAESDPDVWADILVDNSDEVVEALRALVDILVRFERAIHGLDDASLRSLLAGGGAWRRGEPEPEAEVANAGHL